jgi:hypothetical protein
MHKAQMLPILYNKIKPVRRRCGGRRHAPPPLILKFREKNQKSLKKINFETSSGLLMCCMYISENRTRGAVASCVVQHEQRLRKKISITTIDM